MKKNKRPRPDVDEDPIPGQEDPASAPDPKKQAPKEPRPGSGEEDLGGKGSPPGP